VNTTLVSFHASVGQMTEMSQQRMTEVSVKKKQHDGKIKLIM